MGVGSRGEAVREARRGREEGGDDVAWRRVRRGREKEGVVSEAKQQTRCTH